MCTCLLIIRGDESPDQVIHQALAMQFAGFIPVCDLDDADGGWWTSRWAKIISKFYENMMDGLRVWSPGSVEDDDSWLVVYRSSCGFCVYICTSDDMEFCSHCRRCGLGQYVCSSHGDTAEFLFRYLRPHQTRRIVYSPRLAPPRRLSVLTPPSM